MTSAYRADEQPCTQTSVGRRAVLIGIAGTALLGCQTASSPQPVQFVDHNLTTNQQFAHLYEALPFERFPVPAIDVSRIDHRYLRQQVDYSTDEQPGTIIVDPYSYFLYLIQEHGRAMRYGVGVGRQGFGWSGRAVIRRKAQWPTWTPTPRMIEREPELTKYAKGMEPGLDNPLGARALYLYQNGRDTLYRLHGTNEPWSIGQAMSSGCIRLFNQDIIDLYNRTPIGTQVLVRDRPSWRSA